MPQLSLHSPLGALTVTEEDGAIVALDWGFGRDQEETPLLREACAQLDAYFDQRLRRFDLPLAPAGTAFQQRVWQALRDIACGSVVTYGELARRCASAPRAVGGACGRNPVPVLIPCHRVVAGGGSLGGYSAPGGIHAKRFLLDLEGAAVAAPAPVPA